MEYMSNDLVLTIVNILLAVVGSLMVMYLRQIAQRLDKLDAYIERHDGELFQLREKYHTIINEEIAPVHLKLLVLEEKLKNVTSVD